MKPAAIALAILTASASTSQMATGTTARGPNILISGTPGTGKTTLSEALAERTGLRCINVGQMIKDKGYHAGLDPTFDTLVFDEDAENRLLDELEPIMARGGIIIDFHTVDFFPERFFDLVLVLRTDNTILYDRLAARGYKPNKIEENVTAEIMQVVLEEARGSYKTDIVHEVQSNSVEDMASTVDRLQAWVDTWRAEHPA